jgi:hypothetical protein
LEFVGTQDQLVDILTKPLAMVRFQELCRMILVVELPQLKVLVTPDFKIKLNAHSMCT